MKRRGMLVTFALIFAVLIIGFFFPSGQSTNRTASNNSETATETPEEQFTVGLLQTTSHPSLDEIREGTIQGLADNGYVEGENLTINFQNAQGDQNLMNTMASSIVSDGADIVIGIGTPASQALTNATSEIPVIMAAVSDPIGSGLVTSEEEPGGNVTGVKNQAPVEEQIKLMTDILPDVQTVGMLYSSGEDNARAEAERAQVAIEDAGLDLETYTVSNTNEIQQMIATMSREVDVIYLPTDNTIASAFNTVVSEADRYNMPLIPTVDLMIAQGGLATIGISQVQLGVDSGRMAAEVLNGQDPATFPVYIVEGGEQLINVEKAEKIGVTIPEEVLENSRIIEPEEGGQ
ncbi:tryptophan ABC transporter substrate-binding protein [Marinilactibacillus sp. XAAS-LB27]|uniref:tryptophan ABC transporter substrate-binding protein n=1 Tax=Marinilactibacillus sp. XAAS-LB27 TaxID=3114538 RepID=UPI002E189E21|nr:tryptophan ABC transporter substrate-binding protein [Marinilactibacillus sp. XAAS-LB27]